MSKTIIKLSSSAIKDSGCDWRFSSIVLDGYTSKVAMNDTHYGSCFHQFAYVMARTNNNFAEANRAAIKKWNSKPVIIKRKKEHLTEKHLINTCLTYWDDVEAKRSDFESLIDPVTQKPVVELQISNKLYEDDNVEVYLESTLDRLGKIRNGCQCIRDFKTTSSWNAKEYLDQYRSSPQLKLYIWQLKRYAKNHPGSMFDEITRFPMGAVIDGVFLKSAKDTEFCSSDTFIFKDWELAEIETLLMDKVGEIVKLEHLKRLNVNSKKSGKIIGACYTGFKCKFFDVCHAPDDIAAGYILRNEFTQRPFDPLNYDGE